MSKPQVVGGFIASTAYAHIILFLITCLESNVLEVGILKDQLLSGNRIFHCLPSFLIQQLINILLPVILHISIQEFQCVFAVACIAGRHAIRSSCKKEGWVACIIRLCIFPADIDIIPGIAEIITLRLFFYAISISKADSCLTGLS